MKSKRLILAVILVIVLALLFPISNLLFKPTSSGSIVKAAGEDASQARAAEILEAKCALCHVPDEALPFYASFPVASALMAKDVAEGVAHLNLADAFDTPEGGPPISEAALAMIEYTLEKDRMPPGKFLALHWDGGLSRDEKAILLEWVEETRAKHFRTEGVAEKFENHAVQPLPAEHGQDPEVVALGDRMFHDTRLSGDDTLSCASCHGLDKGGTDNAKFSTGIDGQVGDINSPTVFNSGLQFAMFWDGRAADLEEQAGGPVNNPIEMGSNWEQAMGKLKAATDVVEAFAKCFPDGLTPDNVMKSIAVFERSLLTPSKFDRYLRGDEDALSQEEIGGYRTFVDHGCATCHVGAALGGQSYEKMGLKAPYIAGPPAEALGRDNGRFNVTGNENDRHRFKVPTLRNIAISGPYFHDASTDSLLEAVKIMGKHQAAVPLGAGDAERIVTFLEALTGEYKGEQL